MNFRKSFAALAAVSLFAAPTCALARTGGGASVGQNAPQSPTINNLSSGWLRRPTIAEQSQDICRPATPEDLGYQSNLVVDSLVRNGGSFRDGENLFTRQGVFREGHRVLFCTSGLRLES